ncbi:MAG: methylglyoxal synthase, partial [Colwellia sp.]
MELTYTQRLMPAHKRMALVAHDNKKADLIAWAQKRSD